MGVQRTGGEMPLYSRLFLQMIALLRDSRYHNRMYSSILHIAVLALLHIQKRIVATPRM
jgi:hypothetical protein